MQPRMLLRICDGASCDRQIVCCERSPAKGCGEGSAQGRSATPGRAAYKRTSKSATYETRHSTAALSRLTTSGGAVHELLDDVDDQLRVGPVSKVAMAVQGLYLSVRDRFSGSGRRFPQ